MSDRLPHAGDRKIATRASAVAVRSWRGRSKLQSLLLPFPCELWPEESCATVVIIAPVDVVTAVVVVRKRRF